MDGKIVATALNAHGFYSLVSARKKLEKNSHALLASAYLLRTQIPTTRNLSFSI